MGPCSSSNLLVDVGATEIFKSKIKNLDEYISKEISKRNELIKKLQKFFNEIPKYAHVLKSETLQTELINPLKNFYLTSDNFKTINSLTEQYISLCSMTEDKDEEIYKKTGEFATHVKKFNTELFFDHERSAKILIDLCKESVLQQKQVPQNPNEYYKNIAQIILRCCVSNMDSFFFLSHSIVIWINELKQQQHSAQFIDDKVTQLLKYLKQEFPAAEKNLSGPIDQIKNKKLEHKNPIIQLGDQKSGNKKWDKIQKYVMQVAKKAKQLQKTLISITKNACLDNNGVFFKTGVKVHGTASVNRVKQKLISSQFSGLKLNKKKFKEENGELPLDKFLEKQNKFYDKNVVEWLQDQKQIEFTVSDMVRGKCMFQQIDELNRAVETIIKNCQEKNIQIVEIDNRLGKGNTADLVLKILLDDVIAEFQLAYKFNVVSNEFNHKLYELVRSPGFSTVQTLFKFNEKAPKFFLDFAGISSKKECSEFKNLAHYIESLGLYLATEQIKIIQANQAQFKQLPKEEKRQILVNFRTGVFYKNYLNFGEAIECLTKFQEQIKMEEKIQQKIREHYQSQNLFQIAQAYNERGNTQQSLELIDKIEKLKEKQFSKEGELFKSWLQNYEGKQDKRSKKCLEKADFYVKYTHLKGLVLVKQGKYEQALEKFNEQLQVLEHTKGKKSKEYAKPLNNMGLCWYYRMDPKKAMEFFQKMLQILIQLYGKDHYQCAKPYNNMGLACRAMRKIDESNKYFQQSLRIVQLTKGKDSFFGNHAITNIGLNYAIQQNYDKALEYYFKSLQLLEHTKGQSCVDSALVLQNIGLVYLEQKKGQKALEYLQKSIGVREVHNGKDSFEAAPTLQLKGKALASLDRFQQALESIKKSLEIVEGVRGRDSPQTISHLQLIAFISEDTEKWEEALQYYERVMTLKQKYQGQRYNRKFFEEKLELVKQKLKTIQQKQQKNEKQNQLTQNANK